MRSINLNDLAYEGPHDFISFQGSDDWTCLHCDAQTDQAPREDPWVDGRAVDGRCVASEQYSDCGNPFVSHDGPTRWRPGGWGPDGS
jgi:hypothetical protein